MSELMTEAVACIQYYLVGGAVRDMLWGRVPQEFDYAFDADADVFLQLHARARKVGRSVQVFMLDGHEYMPLRGGTLQSDLAARDLTINALALSEQGCLYWHPQALNDLREGVLRAASDHAFADDPTRVLRLARFAALFPHCRVDAATLSQARTVAHSGALAQLPAERVCREVLKAVAAPQPGRFLDVLQQCDALVPWFIELAGAADVPGGPPAYHQHSVLGHTQEIMDRTAGDALATWMALCHDLGKVETPRDIWPHHYGHELRGELAAARLGRRLGMPGAYQQAGVLAARLHMKAGKYESLRAGTRCDLLMTVHQAQLDAAFWRLVEADSGRSLHPRVSTDLALLLAQHLPPEQRNRGAASGAYLRDLRCRALSRAVPDAHEDAHDTQAATHKDRL